MQISGEYKREIPNLKKGTTILGIICESGNAVVIAADSRSTGGHVVAEKRCDKIHRLGPNISCGGAGTAADLHHASNYIATKLNMHRLTTGRLPTVKTAMTLYKRHLFKYGGNVGCYLTLGGYDHTGAHLYVLDATGMAFECMYYTEGSGRIGALPILSTGWRYDMTKEEAVQLAIESIKGGMFNDMGSGGLVNVGIHDKNGYEARMHIYDSLHRQFTNPDFKGFPHQLELVSCETIKFDHDEDEEDQHQNDEQLMELE